MSDDLHTLSMDAIRALDEAALNVLVAKALGWTALETAFCIDGDTEPQWFGISPHGGYTKVRDVAGDLDDAILLLEDHEPDDEVYIEKSWPDGEHMLWRVWIDTNMPRPDETHGDLRRAVVYAWCAWKKGQRE